MEIFETALFERFEPHIRKFDPLDPRTWEPLLLRRDGGLSVYYAPLDHVNESAKLVLIGLTPGKTQLIASLVKARDHLLSGASAEEASREAKKAASFLGMREHLVAMLDHVSLGSLLGIASCQRLFSDKASLLHSTSVLRYPVFFDDSNYNGRPSFARSKLLQDFALTYFPIETRKLQGAIFIPLGPKVAEILAWLERKVAFTSDRVLVGFPHPSGANNERISYFLERKGQGLLSKKTNARKIDEAKASIITKLSKIASI